MPQSQPAAHAAIEILNAARRWAQARAKLRKTLDSKKASERQAKVARAAYSRASDELEGYVGRLERMLTATGQIVSMAKRAKSAKGKPLPWKEILGLVSVGAKAVQDAIEPPADPGAGTPYNGVIDTDGD